jgi:hypothetical protein
MTHFSLEICDFFFRLDPRESLAHGEGCGDAFFDRHPGDSLDFSTQSRFRARTAAWAVGGSDCL